MSQSIIAEIADERTRQMGELGWTFAHDDTHENGQLAKAAIAFTASAIGVGHQDMWNSKRKDRTPRQKLIRAAALLVAEIERRDRATQPETTNDR